MVTFGLDLFMEEIELVVVDFTIRSDFGFGAMAGLGPILGFGAIAGFGVLEPEDVVIELNSWTGLGETAGFGPGFGEKVGLGLGFGGAGFGFGVDGVDDLGVSDDIVVDVGLDVGFAEVGMAGLEGAVDFATNGLEAIVGNTVTGEVTISLEVTLVEDRITPGLCLGVLGVLGADEEADPVLERGLEGDLRCNGLTSILPH